jgi:biotin carboxyl carrier protein
MQKVVVQERSFNVEFGNGILVNGEEYKADILEYRKGKFHALVDGKAFRAEIIAVDADAKTCRIKIGDQVTTVRMQDRYDELLQAMGLDEKAGSRVNDIKAPMPGMVLQVMVEKGQPIRKGDAIVVLEAMKMENILKSPSDGTVKKIHVRKGDKVEKNQVMVDLM